MFRIRPSAAWAVESLGLVCLRRIVEGRPYQARSGNAKFDLLADMDYLSSLLGNHLAAPKA
ncbi:putative molybdenum cofactor guanylyltransferase (fragment) [Sinorhizobium medicae]|uniref:Putative molybdenum cofactor guanylyltransferase n=1 Tax=Sinorhizobium medicae TaxID=110321 RepID=A0A508X861_9HYPH